MRKIAKSMLLICLLLLLLLFIGYFFLAYYYRDGFSFNTWINGVYCTGKTVEEVNEELLSKIEAPIIVMIDMDGESHCIDLAEVAYQEDFTQVLQKYLKEQNAWRWIENIGFSVNHHLTGEISYDDELFQASLENIELIRMERAKENDYRLEYSEEKGYYVYDGLSDRLDIDLVYQKLREAADAGIFVLDLAESGCYKDIPLTYSQQNTMALAQKIEDFQKSNLLYDMGDGMIPLDSAVMSRFIRIEGGEVLLDEDGVKAFVDALAEEYDTYQKEREFRTTGGDVITVPGVTYGTQIDRAAEEVFLLEYLATRDAQSEPVQYHKPAYIHEGVVRGKDDIGSTYIEIDMTQQRMYYYECGELMLETDVVTGHTGRRWDTPEGVNYVYAKQTNRVLRGQGYATPVKYWMPVKGNIGIHDANWRDEFGGTIYQTDGSHGCINTPTDMMAELYEMVDVGTPVIMYY